MSQIFKIMLLGDTSTGKTSFLTQIMYQNAERSTKPTDQLSFFTMRISKPPTVVQIWDSPGDQKYFYQSISALGKFKAVLIFIDVTNDHTFIKAKAFIQQLLIYKHLQIHFVESKVELTVKSPHKRKVARQQLQRLAEATGGGVFTYNLNQKAEPIIQQVIQWIKRERKLQIVFPNKEKTPTSQNNGNCECVIY